MSLLILAVGRSAPRRRRLALPEEPHFDPHAVRVAIAELDRLARQAPAGRLAVRCDVPRFRVSDARRALAGLPAPGDYGVVVRPLRYRTQPHLSGLCEFDVRRIIVRIPEPFRPFEERVYHSARRQPGAGMRFRWVSEKVSFRTRREVLRFVYLHEWLHWYLREMMDKRAGAETACDRFALRNFRRRQVGIDDALEALRGCRTQPMPPFEVGLAA